MKLRGNLQTKGRAGSPLPAGREFANSGAHGVTRPTSASQRGSVLIIVLWIALGLVAITLYFGNSMSSELRASDNRVQTLAADQAIEGAARYVAQVLADQATNGIVPVLYSGLPGIAWQETMMPCRNADRFMTFLR